MTWYTRYTFQMIEKMQRENIKSFQPKQRCVKDLYNHTHELMKRLVWSSRKSSFLTRCSLADIRFSSMQIVVQERQDPRSSDGDLSRQQIALF